MFKRIKDKKIFYKIAACLLVAVLVFVFSFSHPVKTRADVVTGLLLGTGALGALIASYLSASGVQILSNSDSEYSGNLIADYLKNKVENYQISTGEANPYFDSEGNYIGSSDQVSVVQNEQTSAISIIFGKQFAIWLEGFKVWLVNNLDLTSDSSTLFNQSGVVNSLNNQFISFPTRNPNGSISTVGATGLFSVPLTSGDTYTFYNEDRDFFNVSIVSMSGSGNSTNIVFTSSINGDYYSVSIPRNPTTNNVYIYPSYQNNRYYYFLYAMAVNNSATSPSTRINDVSAIINGFDTSISVEGSLTDGYDDFQDALENDLDNADDEQVIVVGLGANDWADILNPEILADDIVSKISIGELVGSYDGTRENKEEAEEELEEKDFVPQFPSDWVVVNGLQDFFPFCIPWDLAFIISLLQAEPEAPYFEWEMNFGKYADPYMITIDFAPYETVARVLRVMMVIVFLFFLVRKTRKLIRG